MPEAVVPTKDAIEALLRMLRQRLEQALGNQQRVKAHIREDRLGFSFTLDIEPKR
jgi:hypothetical protein